MNKLVFLSLLLASNAFPAIHPYHSHCLMPQFSPDEKYIAFWDRSESQFSSWKNTLKLFEIETGRTAAVLERHFDERRIMGVVYQENPEEFEQLAWSPNGRYIGFALTASHFEIYDLAAKKVVSELDIGQIFEITWLNDETIRVGYISEDSPCDWTEDTFALVHWADGSFRIKERVLPAEDNVYEEYYRTTYTIKIDLSARQRIENVKFEKYSDGIASILLIDARENSNERNVLAISKSARYAIVAGNRDEKQDRNPYNNRIDVSLVDIPLKIRQRIVQFLHEHSTRYRSD